MDTKNQALAEQNHPFPRERRALKGNTMRHFLSRDQRKDSSSSFDSSSSKSSISSLKTWYMKRKRHSPSPSPPPQQDSSTLECTSTQSQYVQQRNNTLPTGQIQESDQLEQTISNCRPARPGRRRSSVRLPEILPPQIFTAKELAKRIQLSQPSCPSFIGRVYRPHPEPGLRVETKRRSRESSLLTTRPIYAARYHSPLVTGMPYIAYFEGEIRPVDDEDSVRLALGFVAGRDQASLMPGSERGSIGIHFRDQVLYMNHQRLIKANFRPGEQIGIGIKFSKIDVDAQRVDDAQSLAVPLSPIMVEVFLARDGKKAGSWNLSELREAAGLPFQGLEGHHDLYAAVGTFKEVNVDILFDKRDWRYDPMTE